MIIRRKPNFFCVIKKWVYLPMIIISIIALFYSNLNCRTVSAQATPVYYIVQPGDTLFGIWKEKSNVYRWEFIYTVIDDNALDNNGTIYPGQELVLRPEMVSK